MSTDYAERFRVAFDLHQFGLDLRAQRFRREHPSATESDINKMMARWIAARPADCSELGELRDSAPPAESFL